MALTVGCFQLTVRGPVPLLPRIPLRVVPAGLQLEVITQLRIVPRVDAVLRVLQLNLSGGGSRHVPQLEGGPRGGVVVGGAEAVCAGS